MSDDTKLVDDKLVLIQQIIATDWAALPLEELLVLNPGKSEADLRYTLSVLRNNGYVEVIETDTPDDVPEKFYAATDTAKTEMQDQGIWDGLTILYQIYNEVEVPDRIETIRQHYPNGDLARV